MSNNNGAYNHAELNSIVLNLPPSRPRQDSMFYEIESLADREMVPSKHSFPSKQMFIYVSKALALYESF